MLLPGGRDALGVSGSGLQLFSPLSHTQLSLPKAQLPEQGGGVGRRSQARPRSSWLQPSPAEMRTAHQPSPSSDTVMTLKATSLQSPASAPRSTLASTPGQVCLTLHLRDHGWDMGVFAFRESLRLTLQ